MLINISAGSLSKRQKLSSDDLFLIHGGEASLSRDQTVSKPHSVRRQLHDTFETVGNEANKNSKKKVRNPNAGILAMILSFVICK